MTLFTVATLILLQGARPDFPVEQTKKNIKVLSGLPSSQLIPVMAFMSNSLGVTCAHCHTKEWEADEKPAKDTARRMISMQRAINEQQFGGKLTVTCNTCHRGRTRTGAIPEVENVGWNVRATPSPQPYVSAEDAIGRFPSGGEGVTRRMVRGSVERYNGRDEPASERFVLSVDCTEAAYDTALSHPPEASRALAIYLLSPPERERIAGERWLIDNREIIRRYREITTPLGQLPEVIDYSDSRTVRGVRLPFRAQWSRADYRVIFTIDEISDAMP